MLECNFCTFTCDTEEREDMRKHFEENHRKHHNSDCTRSFKLIRPRLTSRKFFVTPAGPADLQLRNHVTKSLTPHSYQFLKNHHRYQPLPIVKSVTVSTNNSLFRKSSLIYDKETLSSLKSNKNTQVRRKSQTATSALSFNGGVKSEKRNEYIDVNAYFTVECLLNEVEKRLMTDLFECHAKQSVQQQNYLVAIKKEMRLCKICGASGNEVSKYGCLQYHCQAPFQLFLCVHCSFSHPCRTSVEEHILSVHKLSSDKFCLSLWVKRLFYGLDSSIPVKVREQYAYDAGAVFFNEELCPFCNKLIASSPDFMRHFAQEHNDNEILFYHCVVCSYTSIRFHRLLGHILFKHNAENISCIILPASLDKVIIFSSNHVENYPRVVAYRCIPCARDFSYEDEFLRHSFAAHFAHPSLHVNWNFVLEERKGILLHQCPACYRFSSPLNMNQHMMLHSAEIGAINFCCSVCSVLVVGKNQLLQHFTGPCANSKRFRLYAELYSSMQSSKRMACCYCKQLFSHRNQLIFHLHDAHVPGFQALDFHFFAPNDVDETNDDAATVCLSSDESSTCSSSSSSFFNIKCLLCSSYAATSQEDLTNHLMSMHNLKHQMNAWESVEDLIRDTDHYYSTPSGENVLSQIQRRTTTAQFNRRVCDIELKEVTEKLAERALRYVSGRRTFRRHKAKSHFTRVKRKLIVPPDRFLKLKQTNRQWQYNERKRKNKIIQNCCAAVAAESMKNEVKSDARSWVPMARNESPSKSFSTRRCGSYTYYACVLCSFRATDVKEISDHVLIHKSALCQQGFHVCYHCPFRSDSIESLFYHELCHTNYMPYRCSRCNEVFFDKTFAESHLKTCLVPGVGAAQIYLEFSSYDMRVFNSIKFKLDTVTEPSSDTLLSMVFSRSPLSSVNQTVTTTTKPNVDENDSQVLLLQLQSICDKCFFRGAIKTGAAAPASTHGVFHVDETLHCKRYKCSKCYYSASCLSHLSEHEFRHIEKGPFFCTLCEAESFSYKYCKTHVEQAHNHNHHRSDQFVSLRLSNDELVALNTFLYEVESRFRKEKKQSGFQIIPPHMSIEEFFSQRNLNLPAYLLQRVSLVCQNADRCSDWFFDLLGPEITKRICEEFSDASRKHPKQTSSQMRTRSTCEKSQVTDNCMNKNGMTGKKRKNFYLDYENGKRIRNSNLELNSSQAGKKCINSVVASKLTGHLNNSLAANSSGSFLGAESSNKSTEECSELSRERLNGIEDLKRVSLVVKEKENNVNCDDGKSARGKRNCESLWRSEVGGSGGVTVAVDEIKYEKHDGTFSQTERRVSVSRSEFSDINRNSSAAVPWRNSICDSDVCSSGKAPFTKRSTGKQRRKRRSSLSNEAQRRSECDLNITGKRGRRRGRYSYAFLQKKPYQNTAALLPASESRRISKRIFEKNSDNHLISESHENVKFKSGSQADSSECSRRAAKDTRQSLSDFKKERIVNDESVDYDGAVTTPQYTARSVLAASRTFPFRESDASFHRSRLPNDDVERKTELVRKVLVKKNLTNSQRRKSTMTTISSEKEKISRALKIEDSSPPQYLSNSKNADKKDSSFQDELLKIDCRGVASQQPVSSRSTSQLILECYSCKHKMKFTLGTAIDLRAIRASVSRHLTYHLSYKMCCKICLYPFTSSNSQVVRLHLRNHADMAAVKLPASANVVENPFYQSSPQKPNEKTYKCRECKVTNQSFSVIEKHVWLCHLNFLPHKCTRCEFAGVDAASVMSHSVAEHGVDRSIQIKSKNEIASACDKAKKYIIEEDWYMNKRLNEDDLIFTCKSCEGIQFSSVVDILEHSKGSVHHFTVKYFSLAETGGRDELNRSEFLRDASLFASDFSREEKKRPMKRISRDAPQRRQKKSLLPLHDLQEEEKSANAEDEKKLEEKDSDEPLLDLSTASTSDTTTQNTKSSFVPIELFELITQCSPMMFSCTLCSIDFCLPSAYFEHVFSEHMSTKNGGIKRCCACKFTLKTAEDFVKHIYEVHRLQKIPCPVCNQVSENVDKFKLHLIQIHHATFSFSSKDVHALCFVSAVAAYNSQVEFYREILLDSIELNNADDVLRICAHVLKKYGVSRIYSEFPGIPFVKHPYGFTVCSICFLIPALCFCQSKFVESVIYCDDCEMDFKSMPEFERHAPVCSSSSSSSTPPSMSSFVKFTEQAIKMLKFNVSSIMRCYTRKENMTH